MTRRSPYARRRLAWWLLGAGAGLGLLACLMFVGADLLGLAERRAARERTEGTDLRAGSSEQGPVKSLTLAPAASLTKATRGPVLVRLRDRSGAAIADVEVLALQTPPPTAQEEVLSATDPSSRIHVRPWDTVGTARSDAGGEARFGDLPYDGSVKVDVKRAWVPSRGETIIDLVSGDLSTEGNTVTFRFDATKPEGGREHEEVVFTPGDLATWSAVVGGNMARLDPIGDPWHVRAPVTGPELTLTLDRGLPLRLEVREGGQGRLRRDVSTEAWPRWTQAAGSAQDHVLALLPGDDAYVRFEASAPPGWVVEAETTNLHVHPLAQRLEAVVPLRPEVDLVLEVPEACRPYRPEDCALQITVSGRTLERPVLEALGQERLRVRGAPFYVDDVVTVSGTIGSTWNVSGSAPLGDDPRARVSVPLTAMQGVQSEWATAGGPSLTLRFRGSMGAALPLVLPDPMAVTKAPLSLRVVAWDGAPAARARVTIGSMTLVADAAGRVTFPDVADGATKVIVLGAGAPLARTLDLLPGARTEQVLEATLGGTLDVEVVDHEERAVAYPRIEISPSGGLRHTEVTDGTQRIDPYGDAGGRRTYRFVSSGEVAVKATFGSRTAESKVTISEGARESVRIVLPRASP